MHRRCCFALWELPSKDRWCCLCIGKIYGDFITISSNIPTAITALEVRYQPYFLNKDRVGQNVNLDLGFSLNIALRNVHLYKRPELTAYNKEAAS